MPNDNPITTRSSHIPFECAWYRIRQDEVVFPDGSVGQYNVVEVANCVFVVPITSDNQLVLIHQYRYPVQQWVWEVPAGAVKAEQTPLQAAQEELREEIGGTSDDWLYLGEIQTANGRANEIGHVFLAKNVQLGVSAHESAEIITVHPLPIAQVRMMIFSNQLQDAPSALAILLAEPHFSPPPPT